MRQYLDFMCEVVTSGRKHRALDWDDAGVCEIRTVSPRPHAGGPAKKQKAANDSCSVSTGADGASVAASGDDDDDGDGDGDPDSDRRKITHTSKSSRKAPLQRPSENRILRMPALRDKIGLSRSTIYELISRGEFVASISLGPRAVGWRESDVDDWLESRATPSKAA